jgi:peptidoglycan-associated lipoprotein
MVVLLASIAAACGGDQQVQTQPTQPPPAPAQATAPKPPPPPATVPPPPPTAAAPLTEDQLFAQKTLEQLNKEQPLADVFFDYDQSSIRDEGRAALQKNAEWLRRWTSTRITVEGHCDSRGSSEYNLALGARRAAAVQEYLVSLGVQPSRITVVSKGKEQPFCAQETESCWQQNRRGHFLITAK